MMECETYRALVQQTIDGMEPGDDVRAQMRAHEEACEACREESRALWAVHAWCARMDKEIEPPEEFARSWRQAVRREHARQAKRRFSPGALTAIAAGVLALSVGISGAFQFNGGKEQVNLNKQMQYSSSYMADMASEPNPNPVLGMNSVEEYAADYADSGMRSAGAAASGAAAAQPAAKAEKRIRTASISIRTGGFDAALTDLRATVAELGGYVGSEDIYGVAGEEARSAYMNVQVEAGQLDTFLTRAAGMGQVRDRSVNEQDVTDRYVDISGRLESAVARRDRLNELIAQAQGMSDLIELEAALSDVQLTIENYEHMLSDIDTRVAYATVNVYIEEMLTEDATREGENGLLARMNGALGDSLKAMGRFAKDAAVFGVAALPWAGALAVAGGVIALIIKRRRTPKKKGSM